MSKELFTAITYIYVGLLVIGYVLSLVAELRRDSAAKIAGSKATRSSTGASDETQPRRAERHPSPS
jgi:hypothetical protein